MNPKLKGGKSIKTKKVLSNMLIIMLFEYQ